jgi:hypothetical protein
VREHDADVGAEPVDLLHQLGGVAVAATPQARARAAAELADRLVRRAESDDVAALSALLRGNPRREATVWRALQFRLGDVSPSSDAPHDNPCTAVLAVARAADGSHVASELVAVDADGSAWTALVRTDDELVVQVPSPRTLVGPVSAPDAVGPLLLAWREALGGLRVEAAKAQGPDDPAVIEPAVAVTEPGAPDEDAAPAGDVEASAAGAERAQTNAFDRLDAPGAPLDRLRAGLQADLAARLTALEARLGLAAEEGARLAVARAMQDVHDELQVIRDQLARLEKHITG